MLNQEDIAKMTVGKDGTIFFTLRRSGRLMALPPRSERPVLVASFKVLDIGETGLLGVALHPDFPSHPVVYVYSTQDGGGAGLGSNPENRITSLRIDHPEQLARGGRFSTSRKVILDDIPASPIHNGGALAVGPDRKLYATTGDARRPEQARNLEYLGGKILRLELDGDIPKDNPFKDSPVYSFGHRNIFGIAFMPSLGAWTQDGQGEDRPFDVIASENGPDRDDEVNLVVRGADHGWPQATGASTVKTVRDSSGRMPTRKRSAPSAWSTTPCIAPTGIAVIPSGANQGDILLGDYNTGSLRVLALNPSTSGDSESQPPGEPRSLREVGAVHSGDPIFDIATDPTTGELYVVTSAGIFTVRF